MKKISVAMLLVLIAGFVVVDGAMSEPGVEKKVFVGHTKDICALAFSSDGKLLATASHDQTIKVWNVFAGTLQQILSCGGTVSAFAFNPDNSQLVIAFFDGSVKIWDLKTDQLIFTVPPRGLITSLAFRSDGKLIGVSYSPEEKVTRVLDVNSGDCLCTCELEYISVFGSLIAKPRAKLSLDGTCVAIEKQDQIIEIREIENYSRSLHTISLSSTGQTLSSFIVVSFNRDTCVLCSVGGYNVYLFDLIHNRCLCKFMSCASMFCFYSLALSPDGTTFAAGRRGGVTFVITDVQARKSADVRPWNISAPYNSSLWFL